MASPAALLSILVTANTAPANAALAGTQTRLRATAMTSTRMSSTMKKAFVGVGLAAGAAGVALFKVGEEFDKAYDTIRTRTGATDKELEKLKDSFRNVVTDVPADFDTASKAIAGLNQRLDITGRPLERLTKQLTELSRITGTDIDQNVQSVTRLFGDWSVKTAKQTRTLDRLFRLTQDTGIALGDLTDLMVQFGAPLRSLGFSFDEAAVMFARFEKEGVNIQTLMPGMRMALKNLSIPADDLKSKMQELGIAMNDPKQAIQDVMRVFLGGDISKADRTFLASAVFGGRAWTDMSRAIQEGRFEFDDLIKRMRMGDDTIRKAGRSTMDFNEQWLLFKNRVMVFLEPLATKVFVGLSSGMRELNRLLRGQGGFAEGISSAARALRDFWNQSAIFRTAVKVMGEITERTVSAIKETFRGMAQATKGIVQVISGVLTLRFDRAWDGVKNIFGGGVRGAIGIMKTLTAPIRDVAQRVGGLLTRVFGGAWDQVKGIFVSSKDRLRAVMDGIGRGITGVLRGIRRAFKGVADVIRSVVKFIVNAVNRAVGALGDLKSKIPDITPDVSIPDVTPWSGLAPWQKGGVIVGGTGSGDKVPSVLEPGEVVWNREAVKAIFGTAQNANAANKLFPRFAKGGIAGLQPGISRLVNWASQKYGLKVSSGLRPGDPGFHGQGAAADLVPPSMKATQGIFGAFKNQLAELFYDPWGGWDSGQHIGPIGGHMDHIHAAILGAGGPAAMARIKRIVVKGRGPLADMAQGAADMMRKAANNYLRNLMPTTTHGNISAKGSLQGIARKLIMGRWGKGQWPPFSELVMRESGWDPTAVNPSSGAAGLAQALPPSKYPPGAWPYTGKSSAVKQLQWMVNYIAERYGTPSGAIAWHDAHNWYAQGGVVPGPMGKPQKAVVHGGEAIIPPGGFSVIVHGDIYSDRKDPVEVVIGDRRFKAAVRNARMPRGNRNLPGSRVG